MTETQPNQFDRLPPHSIEAEMCVIGALLQAGDDCQVFEATRSLLTESDFFQADHALLFRVICMMADAGVKIDGVTVRDELEKRHVLEEVGGTAYLAELISGIPSVSHGSQYAKIVRERSMLRRLIAIGNDVIRRCYAPAQVTDPATEVCSWLDEQVIEVMAGHSGDEIYTLADVLEEVIETKKKNQLERIPTGQRGLDDIIGGLPIAGFTMIGGRPGMGKSQELKQLVLNYASAGKRCGIVSLEETRQKMARNMLANKSGIQNAKLAYGEIGEVEWREVELAVPKLKALPIFFNDAAAVWSEVAKAVTSLAIRHKCEVVGVDYLQLIGTEERDSTREQEVARISRGLKRLFKRLGIIGIAAVQLNRGSEVHQQEPDLKNLRESGQLEQDGDVILLLHRSDYYHYKDPGFQPTRCVKVIVAKNKDGRLGSVDLKFDGDTQSIIDPLAAVEWRSAAGPSAADAARREVDDFGI